MKTNYLVNKHKIQQNKNNYKNQRLNIKTNYLLNKHKKQLLTNIKPTTY